MAQITLTVDDAHVATIKAAVEYYAITRSDLTEGQTYTTNQFNTYLKNILIARLRELVFVHKQSNKHTTANEEAQNDANTLSIT